MKDLFERLYDDVLKEAQNKQVPKARVIEVFLRAYERHKAQHGSFKHHPEYHKVMTGRYQWMHDQTIQFINRYMESQEVIRGKK